MRKRLDIRLTEQMARNIATIQMSQAPRGEHFSTVPITGLISCLLNDAARAIRVSGGALSYLHVPPAETVIPSGETLSIR